MEREEFLRRVAPRPYPGPDLPDLAILPRSPMELRAGEDPIERFVRESKLVGQRARTVDATAVGDAVVAALNRHGARRIAIAADIGRHLETVTAALTSSGLDAVPYAIAAGDRDLAGALDATVTGCAAAVAATASIVMTARAGRAAGLIAPLHVCIVDRRQLVGGISDVLRRRETLDVGSMMAFQSGPSRTADIEKTLIIPAHGPAVVEVLIVA